MFAQPLYAMVAEEGLNCDQTDFLFVEFVGSDNYPADSVGYLWSRFKLMCCFKPRPVQRTFWLWRGRTWQQGSLGGRGLSARALAGGGMGLGCSVCSPEFNFHKEELYLRSFGQ